jgi:hypothetical protein
MSDRQQHAQHRRLLGRISIIIVSVGLVSMIMSSFVSQLLWIGWIIPIGLALGITATIIEKKRTGLIAVALSVLVIPIIFLLPAMQWSSAWLVCGGHYPVEAFDVQDFFDADKSMNNSYYSSNQQDYISPVNLITKQQFVFGIEQPDAYFCSDDAANNAGYDNTNNQDGGHDSTE